MGGGEGRTWSGCPGCIVLYCTVLTSHSVRVEEVGGGPGDGLLAADGRPLPRPEEGVGPGLQSAQGQGGHEAAQLGTTLT